MSNKSITDIVYKSVFNMHKIGVVDTTTLREFDEACLPKIKELSADEIKKLRLSCKVSQAVFAKLLNASLSTVRQWEIGEKKPNGVALKILYLVKQNGVKILYAA